MFSVILNLEDNPSSEYVTVVEAGEDFLESTFEHGGEFNILSVEPLVRCRECKWFNHIIERINIGTVAEKKYDYWECEFGHSSNDEWFCADGAREDDERFNQQAGDN